MLVKFKDTWLKCLIHASTGRGVLFCVAREDDIKLVHIIDIDHFGCIEEKRGFWTHRSGGSIQFHCPKQNNITGRRFDKIIFDDDALDIYTLREYFYAIMPTQNPQ